MTIVIYVFMFLSLYTSFIRSSHFIVTICMKFMFMFNSFVLCKLLKM